MPRRLSNPSCHSTAQENHRSTARNRLSIVIEVEALSNRTEQKSESDTRVQQHTTYTETKTVTYERDVYTRMNHATQENPHAPLDGETPETSTVPTLRHFVCRIRPNRREGIHTRGHRRSAANPRVSLDPPTIHKATTNLHSPARAHTDLAVPELLRSRDKMLIMRGSSPRHLAT